MNQKTTVYLPTELQWQLDAEAARVGVSKAELIRRAVAKLLAECKPSYDDDPPPIFSSGRSLTVEEMDKIIKDRIVERAARS